jgi:hypothetical protein
MYTLHAIRAIVAAAAGIQTHLDPAAATAAATRAFWTDLVW